MKSILRSAAIVGGLVLATAGIAQDKTSPAKPAQAVTATDAKVPANKAQASTATPRVNDGFHGINIGVMIKRLGITEDQTAKLKDINANYYKVYQTIPADMPLEDRKTKVTSIMAQRELEVKKVLTAEQQAPYEQLAKEQAAGTILPAGSAVPTKPVEQKKVDAPK